MASNDSLDHAAVLEDARQQIARWRETRPRRGARMPAAVWATAVAAAQRGGLGRTARALGLDYGTLKRRVTTAAGAGPSFVELGLPLPLIGLGACVLAIEGRHGRRLRVEVSGLTVSDLLALAQGLWVHAG